MSVEIWKQSFIKKILIKGNLCKVYTHSKTMPPFNKFSAKRAGLTDR